LHRNRPNAIERHWEKVFKGVIRNLNRSAENAQAAVRWEVLDLCVPDPGLGLLLPALTCVHAGDPVTVVDVRNQFKNDVAAFPAKRAHFRVMKFYRAPESNAQCEFGRKIGVDPDTSRGDEPEGGRCEGRRQGRSSDEREGRNRRFRGMRS
jgi:hypothetical protein